MSANETQTFWEASPDYLRPVADQTLRVVVVKIAAAQWMPSPTLPEEKEHGVVALDVLELIHGEAPRPGERVEMRVQREVADLRLHRGQNTWNDLTMLPGEVLLLMCRPTGATGVVRPVAATEVASTTDSRVLAMRWAYAVAALPHDARREALAQGLVSRDEAFGIHALMAITHREALGREEGIEVFGEAILSGQVPPRFTRNLADALLTWPLQDGRMTDRARLVVLAAMEHGMLAEPEPRYAREWSARLESALYGGISSEVAPERHLHAVARIRAAGPSARAMLDLLTTLSKTDRPKGPYNNELGKTFWEMLEDYRAAAEGSP